MVAARRGRLAVCRLLLQKGGVVEIADRRGYTVSSQAVIMDVRDKAVQAALCNPASCAADFSCWINEGAGFTQSSILSGNLYVSFSLGLKSCQLSRVLD